MGHSSVQCIASIERELLSKRLRLSPGCAWSTAALPGHALLGYLSESLAIISIDRHRLTSRAGHCTQAAANRSYSKSRADSDSGPCGDRHAGAWKQGAMGTNTQAPACLLERAWRLCPAVSAHAPPHAPERA